MTSITIKDSGWTLPDDLEALEAELKAGILEGAQAHEDIGTAELALIHEDGAPGANIRARSFMRPTFDRQVGGYVDELESITAAAVKGDPTGPRLAGLADRIADDMRQTILRGRTGGPPIKSPPNVALRRLGLTPLVDSGALVESINGQVVGGKVGGG
jgi:hypothetical protein